jgi:hypothetical protein
MQRDWTSVGYVYPIFDNALINLDLTKFGGHVFIVSSEIFMLGERFNRTGFTYGRDRSPVVSMFSLHQARNSLFLSQSDEFSLQPEVDTVSNAKVPSCQYSLNHQHPTAQSPQQPQPALRSPGLSPRWKRENEERETRDPKMNGDEKCEESERIKTTRK